MSDFGRHPLPPGRPGRLPTEIQVARVRSGDRTGFAGLFDRLAPSLEARVRVAGSLRDYVEPDEFLPEG